MFRFRRPRHGSRAGAAVAEPPPAPEFDGTTDELLAEIGRLTEANRDDRDPATERRLLTLRHLAGIRLLDGAPPAPEHPAPAFDRLPEADGLPDIARADLTPELLRAGILRDGCLLVRGLVPREAALAFAQAIDRSFDERERAEADDGATAGWYEEFSPHPRFGASTSGPGSRRAAACWRSTRPC